jgi:glycogen operon protein
MTEQDWNFPEGHFLSYVLGPLERGRPPLYVVLNAADHALEFFLPKVVAVQRWSCVFATVLPREARHATLSGHKCHAPAHSVLVFAGAP